jgi:hypothetical protein
LISFLGGVGVVQVKITFSKPAQSAFLKIAQTFCILLIDSKRIILDIIKDN